LEQAIGSFDIYYDDACPDEEFALSEVSNEEREYQTHQRNR
jgi:hypothetical protein